MKKSNKELGYTIPVQKKLSPGRYKIAYTKSLKPDSNNQIKVRTSKLTTKMWNAKGVEIIPNYGV